jgi:hypothetical protein
MFRKSFTILEVVVGIVIFIIAISSLMAISSYVTFLLHRERREITALEHANSILENLVFDTAFDDANFLSFGMHQVARPACPQPGKPCFWGQFNPIISYDVTPYDIDLDGVPPPTPADAIAKQITVTISWDEKFKRITQRRSESLTSIKLKDE